jgi:hypothetical protein
MSRLLDATSVHDMRRKANQSINRASPSAMDSIREICLLEARMYSQSATFDTSKKMLELLSGAILITETNETT